ncbi:hypothetical protein WH433_24700, partial [Salmonella enterica subsp. enterica]|uniref:hypothetical protein n=1 Tax=Salmonella enterica TaxID=28901 RepID=UPI0030B08B72
VFNCDFYVYINFFVFFIFNVCINGVGFDCAFYLLFLILVVYFDICSFLIVIIFLLRDFPA